VELSLEGRDSASLGFQTAMLCEQRGLHITYSYFEPVMRIIPPLIISQTEIDLAISILDEALTVLEKGQVKLSEITPRNCKSGPFINGMMTVSPTALMKKMWSTSPQQWVKKIRSMREHA
jgi:hypothetical protein